MKNMGGKIKFIFVLFFLIIFSSGCLYDEPNTVSELGSESDPREKSTEWESASEPDPREVIHRDYDQQVEEGADVVASHIHYLEEVDRGNEKFLQAEPDEPINEARKRQLQKAAKSRHFEQLGKLLRL